MYVEKSHQPTTTGKEWDRDRTMLKLEIIVSGPRLQGARNGHVNNNNNNNNNTINYTSTYARKQGYNWTKNTGMNMCQNQQKQVKEEGNHTVEPTN